MKISHFAVIRILIGGKCCRNTHIIRVIDMRAADKITYSQYRFLIAVICIESFVTCSCWTRLLVKYSTNQLSFVRADALCRYWQSFHQHFRNLLWVFTFIYKLFVFQDLLISITYFTRKCDIVRCWPVLIIPLCRGTHESFSICDSGSSTCFRIHTSCIKQGQIGNEIGVVGINKVRRHVPM